MFSVALLLLLAAGCVKCVQIIQPASVTVQPGHRLTITCEVSYSLSSDYTAWIRQPAGKGLEWIGMAAFGSTTLYKDSLKNKFSIRLDPSRKTVTLNGQNMQPEDAAVYYCARDYGYAVYAFEYWGKGTMVTVTSAPSTAPTVFPLTQCSGTGDMVTLGCLATGFTPSSLAFSWTKNGVALTDFIQYPPVQKGDSYTGVSQIQVRRQDWSAEHPFQCAVTHPAGSPTVVIPGPPGRTLPTLTVLVSCDEQNEASFSCFAKDFSPEHHEIKWLKNNEDITSKMYEVTTPPHKNGTLFSAASFLKVPPSDWRQDGTTVTCLFEGKAGSVNSSVTYTSDGTPCHTYHDVDVEIMIIGPEPEDMFLHRKGKIVCQVKVNKPTLGKIWWEDEDGKVMVGSPKMPVQGKTNTFSVSLDISYDEWSQGIKRVCIVEHSEWLEPFKKPYERNIGGETQRPSVFMLPPVEHTRKETVTLTCYVKDFFPRDVFVSWLVDDEEVDSNYESHTTNPITNNGSYSVYGQLLVSREQWQKNDMVYSCVVHHESMVNTTKAIVRSIEQRTTEKTNLVNLNMNIPEICKAQ